MHLLLLSRLTEKIEIFLSLSGTAATSNRRDTVFPVNRRETVFAGARRETVFFAEQPGQNSPAGETDLNNQLRSQVNNFG